MARALTADTRTLGLESLSAASSAVWAAEAAGAAGFTGPLGPAARDLFERAVQAGLGDLDDAALFRLLSQPGR